MAQAPRLGLIVGLGNPGAQYARTRHNAGHWFVDRIAERYAASFKIESRFKAETCRVNIAGDSIWLLKPAVFMNESGYSVATCAAYYKLNAAQTLVAHDELGINCGELRLKQGGGHAGHNGLRDIMSHLSADFLRLRIGIGHPGQGQDVARYVLNVPRSEESQLIDNALDMALEYVDDIASGHIERVAKKMTQGASKKRAR